LECVKAVQQNSNYPHELVIFENLLGGWVRAVREMIKDLGEDPIVVIGDDTLPQPDWLKILVESYKERFPRNDGLAQPDDGLHRGRIASYPMATPRFLQRWIYSGYKHNYADKELRNVAQTKGMYLWVAESKVVHLDRNVRPELYDDTYALQEKTRSEDQVLYKQRSLASNQYQNWETILWDEEVKS